ncbi:nuclear localization sequence binding protein [Coemansia brasiliensis]|uniref:Nuclear localization sequence binding protein n=1 Tax=Coemansia brasiliensis TaxID=2650707 RepID=A0A9W8IBU2_9FUNG|nr:nuclear localization sequence binding protein [Coemansia brasiliensis]
MNFIASGTQSYQTLISRRRSSVASDKSLLDSAPSSPIDKAFERVEPAAKAGKLDLKQRKAEKKAMKKDKAALTKQRSVEKAKKKAAKKQAKEEKKKAKKKEESESSSSESESEEEKPVAKAAESGSESENESSSSESKSSSSESESSSSESEAEDKAGAKDADSDSESSSSDSDSDSDSESKSDAKEETAAKASSSEASDSDSSDSDSSDSDSDSDSSSSESSDAQMDEDSDSGKRKADDSDVEMEDAEAPAKQAKKQKTEDEVASVFVGNLSFTATVEGLKDTFSEYGTVVDARIATESGSGRSRGFGYVDFASEADREKALAAEYIEIDGRQVRLDKTTSKPKREQSDKPANEPSKTLFIGNLSFYSTEDSIRDAFSECGNVVSVRIITDKETGRPKGFGYIEFDSLEASASALEWNGSDLDGRNIRLDYSTPRANAGERGERGGRGGRRGGRGGGRGGRFNSNR